MKKQKKFLAVLSAAAVSTMIAAAVSTTAFAKTTHVIAKINGQEVKINFEELTTAYENKAAGLDSELFNKYNEREGLTALLDDTNGFVDYKAVQEAAEDAVALGEKFVLNDFTENTEKTLADFKPEAEWKDDKVVPVTPVEEGLKVESVSAINSTQAEVKFSKEVKEVKPANFKVTDKDGNLLFVSKAELNEAKTVATLSFFDAFADKGVYTVEVSNVADVDGNVMEKATAQFGYEKAEVAKVEFTATTVALGTELKKVVKVTDALGRDVTEEVKIEFESSNNSVVSADGKAGNEAGSAIVVAKVKVGDSYVKTAPTTIKVADKTEATFVGLNVYAGINPAGTTEDFEKLKADKKSDFVYITDKGDAAKKLALYYNDQYGKSMDAVVNNLNVTNLTPAIVIVENDGTITPISAGEGYVKVKANDKLEHTIKIVVREKATIATMELDKTDVSVVADKAAETVKVTFKDQFGTKVSATPTAKSAATEIATVKAEENLLTITGVKEGTTTVEVTYKDVENKVDLKETINVTVTKAADLATYKAEVKATKLDVDGYEADAEDADKKDKLPKSTDVVVYEIDANGNKLGKATNVTLKEVDKDGKAVAAGKELVTISKQNVEAAKTGTAYVQVKVGSLVIDTLEFEIVKTESIAKTAEVENLTLSEKISEVKDAKLDEVIKKNIVLKDQYGNVMKDNNKENIQPDTIKYTLTNADGVSVKDDKIEGIKKDKALVDVVLTEVKTNVTDDKNLLAEPVVIKLQVNVDLPAPKDGKTELAIEGLTSENAKFMVKSLTNESGGQKVATLDEVVEHFKTNNITFNSDAIKIEDGKISIVGEVLSTEDWYKIKSVAGANSSVQYKITVLKGENKNTDKVAKIAFYADGTAVIEEYQYPESN